MLHSQVVAHISPVFAALINGGLSEAQTRTAELEDIDSDTFARLTEFAYRQDYTVPTWTRDENIVVTMHNDEPSPPPVMKSPAGNFGVSAAEPHRKLVQSQEKTTMRDDFLARTYLDNFQKPRDALISGFEPVSNSSADQDFTTVFLAHAQLYNLADMRLILPLKTLTLHKLHRTLSSFSLYEKRLADVLELAKYAYSRGEDRSEDGELDELRELVVEYIACEHKSFGKHRGFKYLMDSEGEFAGDLWDIISQELL